MLPPWSVEPPARVEPPATSQAAAIMGVNQHNNLITPHNGEDEQASITQRGVFKEEWRPWPAG